MVRPMIWLAEASASNTIGAWTNCGITPPTTTCRPTVAATAANTAWIPRRPPGSAAPARRPCMKAKKAMLRPASASWARRL